MTMTEVGTGQQGPVGLNELVRVPVRRWRTVLALAGSVTLAAVAYLVLLPPTYTATSIVIVRPVVTDPFSVPNGGVDRAIDMAAEVGIATSNEVLDKVAATTGHSHEETGDALQVEHPVSGQVMRFKYTGRTATEAIAGANTAAETYLAIRRAVYDDQRAGVLKSYDSTIKTVNRQREQINDDLPRSEDPTRASALLDQLRAMNDQLAKLAEQRSKIASADLTAGRITSQARLPVPSSRDTAPLYLLAAVLGGLLIGVVTAVVQESLDRRITSAADAAEITGLPLLGTAHRPVTAATGISSGMRYLALALTPWVDRTPTEPLVLLSERDDEHRSEVSVGLAAAMARAGYDVYLGSTPESLERLHALLLAAQRRTMPTPERHRASSTVVGSLYTTSPYTPQAAVPATGDDLSAVSHATAARGADSPLAAEPTGTIPVGVTAGTVPVGVTAGTIPVGVTAGGDTATAAAEADTSVGSAPGPPAVVGGPAPGTRTASAARPASVSPPNTASATARRATTVPAGQPGADPDLVLIGPGSVRLGSLDRAPTESVVLLDAPAARDDDRGVWAARGGHALLVVACDVTRSAELRRLADRLSAAGVQAIGFVLSGDRRA